MNPYEAVGALRRSQDELDHVVARLGGARPRYWRGPAARAFEGAREDLIAHAVAARAGAVEAERLMIQFAAEASTP
ncbi:MAG: hypothetical protein L0G23_03420 [Ruaniaceae bacterium]|nr:hypothetical protein [Ruaniaceae bacterium]